MYLKKRGDKLLSWGQIQPTTCFSSESLTGTTVYILSVLAFKLQLQSQIVLMEMI